MNNAFVSKLLSSGRDLASMIPPIGRLREQRDRLAAELDVSAARADDLATRVEELGAALDATSVSGFPPGHFYSPIPDLDEVRRRETSIFDGQRPLPGISLDLDHQLARLGAFAAVYAELPYPSAGPVDGLRYRFDNEFFGHGDAISYYCMLRTIEPARLIEVGSGWSSALALDVNQRFLDGRVELTFIEPHPERLQALLSDDDRATTEIIEQPLHHVDPAIFDQLAAGDVLFIDSTHVCKIGSDVHELILDVLPTLRPGVHVHVHDIFYPFEYPRGWVYEGRAWNEIYVLRSYLANNPTVRINWFNSYLRAVAADQVAARLPLWAHNPGGSIWLETM